MAEEVVQEEVKEKKGSFGKILFLGFNVLLFLAGVAFFGLTKFGIIASSAASEAPMATEGEADMTKPQAAQKKEPEAASTEMSEMSFDSQAEPVLVSVPTFIVNLSGDRGRRYLSLAMDMQVEAEEAKEQVEKRLPQIRNRLIFLLSNKTFEDVSSVEGKYELQDEISRHVNEVIGKTLVRKTMFTSFVVQ